MSSRAARLSTVGDGRRPILARRRRAAALRVIADGDAQAVEVALEGREVELVALLDVLGQRGELHLELRLLHFEAAALIVALR